ncbi:LysM peptidoglycan-binding domain-containing protein [uncultured Roseibium sp.]|uniref:LysM peptidoglycan-binding domain-containing protein n=1 Tax=uncultured Roseibium sp. TaxID=1936171 RepID=UPI002614E54B|nr:LysM peptidoglycan-binding domain-containing protein [uncultured Roseibium sp.]
MNNKTLIWTLIVAVPVGLAALVTGYIYRDTGRLPFQSGPEVAATPSVSGDAATTEQAAGSDTGTKTQSAETDKADASDEAPAAKTASAGPSFDVVGVEPTGETVVAGRSVAGAIVALTANGKVVGKSIANEVGEWTIILDEPLKPGDYDVGLEVHDDTGKAIATSEERLAVSLPEGGKEQPLVVLNTPDGPSDVLQKPAAEQQVASTTSTGEGSQTAATTNPAEGTAAEASGSTSATETATAETAAGTSASQQAASQETSEQPAGTSEQTAVASTDTTSSGTGTAEPETAGSGAAVSTAEASGQPASEETEVASTSSGTAPAAVTTQDSGADVAQAGQNEPADVPAAAPDAPTVTVEAVESEKDKVFVAGTGEPGSSVRVYVGDEFQGEAKVGSGGKWLIEGGKNISEGNVEVRADLIGEDGSSVDARAAVTFEKEQDKQIVLTKVVASGEGAGADGQGAEVKKSLPVVIIRKGDNLWRISRRLYGEGVRYTTIYKANQQQIRNPDLIYPGQVFLTPEGDLSWPKPDENNG